MGERVQVNFQVDESRKEAWAEYADDEGLPMSAMIRQAVEAHINRDERGGQQIDDGRLSDLLESNKRIQGQLRELSDDMAVVKTAVEAPDEDMRTLAREVFSVLPEEGKLGTTIQTIDGTILVGFDEDRDGRTTVQGGTVLSGLVTDIADYLDEPPYLIEDAIEQLRDDTNLVHETVVDGERRFHK
jgi:hypothetical protein